LTLQDLTTGTLRCGCCWHCGRVNSA